MEETYCLKTIILNRTPFREYDSKTTVYSPDRGKLDLVARGVKKIKSKLAAHLEPLNLTEIMVVRGRQFDYIGAAVSRNCYQGIKRDLAKLQAAGRAINIFNKLVKWEEADKEVFSLLEEFLDFLDKEAGRGREQNCELGSSFFVFKLLVCLGYKPQLYSCAACHKKITPAGNSFDLSRGGLVCQKCSSVKKGNVLTISDNGIKVLRAVVDNGLKKLKNLKISAKLEAEVKNIISSFFQYHI